MQDWVKYKLEKINDIYPPERVNKNKKRWEDLWYGVKPNDRYPYLLGFPLFRAYVLELPPKEYLEKYLDTFVFRGYFDDDYVPSIFPGCNNATIPNMFGANEVRFGEVTTSTKLIQTYEDIKRLPEPRIEKGSIAQKWLDMQSYFLEETEGQVPIRVVDMQGPIDACSHMWSYEDLFICGHEEPELLHLLLSKMTDAFIMLWNAQKQLLGDAFVGSHFTPWDHVPKDGGASMSVDSLTMYSPQFYNEFIKPQLEYASRELGGLAVHSCGKYPAMIPSLCDTEGITALNPSQMTIAEICNAGGFSNRVVKVAQNLDDLQESLDIAIKNDIRPSITVDGLWGQIHSDMSKPSEWSAEEKKIAKDFQERVCRIMHRL